MRRPTDADGSSSWRSVVLAVAVMIGPAAVPTTRAVDAPGAGRLTQLKYRVFEEQPRGTFVGNVLEDARLSTRLTFDVLRQIRFRFLDVTNTVLAIDPLSGVLTTNDVIDRDAETLCQQREQCEISVQVILQPVQYFQV